MGEAVGLYAVVIVYMSKWGDKCSIFILVIYKIYDISKVFRNVNSYTLGLVMYRHLVLTCIDICHTCD